MNRIWTTKVDNFAVTVDCSLFIFATVMPEMTFHQPGLSMVRIDLQYAVNKDLGNLPTFFRNRTCRVGPVDADLRILVTRM
jgi:hypothetical protein